MTKLVVLRPGEAKEFAQPADAVAKVGSSDLVLAWAKDMATGEPRHIGELGKEQTGQKCGQSAIAVICHWRR